jgi:hypothetical protein
MFRTKVSKNLLKLQKIKSSKRANITRNESFESWKINLTIIKAERLRQRIVSIIIICIFLLFLYSGNITALIYVISFEKFIALNHISGLIYNFIGLFSILIFERSLKLKSINLNNIYLSIIWIFFITSLLSNLVLISLLVLSKWSKYLENRVKQLELDFHSADLLTSIILFMAYLLQIILLISLRNDIFEFRKYDKSIQNSDSNKSKMLSKGKELEPEVQNKIMNKSLKGSD